MDYCAKSERATHDVRTKLIQWGLDPEDVDEVIANLIEQNFLNESRYAIAYAKDKMRFNKWGKNKIKAGLFAKYISEYCIQEGLDALNLSEYEDICESIVNSRLEKEIKRSNGNTYLAKNKTIQYAMAKGFEYSLIEKWIEHYGNN